MADNFKSNVSIMQSEMIMKWFKEDCKTIMHLFSQIVSGDYQDFAQLWKHNGFGLCTLLHKNMTEIIEFNREGLEVAKGLFLAQDDIDYLRIAALYLLYTLYDRQSIRCGNRINVNINEYKLFTKIILDLYIEGHKDAKYIYLLLEENSAFDYILSGDQQTQIEDTVNSDSSKSFEVKALSDNEDMILLLKETVDSFKEDYDLIKLQNNKLSDAVKTIAETMEKNLEAITSAFSDPMSSGTNNNIEFNYIVSNRESKNKAMANDSQDLAVDKNKKILKRPIKCRRWRGSVTGAVEDYDSSTDDD